MADNKQNEVIYNKAFKALKDALSSDSDYLHADSEQKYITASTKNDDSKPSSQQSDASKFFSSALSPANDISSNSITHILKNIDKTSISTALRNSTIISFFWVLFGLIVAIKLYRVSEAQSFYDIVSQPGSMMLLMAIIFPVMLFFSFSIMIARAQEMRNATRSIAEVALRLVEPETVASERVVSVGQTVRREVSAMSEGIERSIARASELETLVHSEVNALERSYADNEMRMRNLIEQLSAERESIFNHAERIRSSIVEVHNQIREELSLTHEDISLRLSTSGEAFASMIDSRISSLTEKTYLSIESLVNTMSSKTSQLLQTLSSTGSSLNKEFDERLLSLSIVLNESGRNFLDHFGTHASTLNDNTEKLNLILDERVKQLNKMLVDRTDEISEGFSLGESSIKNSLHNALKNFNASLEEQRINFHKSLQLTSDEAIMDIDLRAGLVEDRLKATVEKVSTVFDNSIAEFTDAFDNRFGALDTKLVESLASINGQISSSYGNIESLVFSNVQGINSSLQDHASVLSEALSSGQKGIENVINKGSEEIGNTLINNIKDIALNLEEKRQQINSDLNGRSEAISSSIKGAYQEIDNMITEHNTSFINSLIETQSKFEKVLSDRPQVIVDSLSKDIGKLTETLYDKTMALAIALSESQKLLEDTLESHTNSIVEKISNAENEVAENFSKNSESIYTAYDNNHKKLQETLQNHAKSLANIFHSNGEQLDHVFGSSTERMGSLLSNNSSRIEEILNGGSSGIDLALSTAHKRFSQTLEKGAELISTTIEEKHQKIDSNILKHSDRIDTIMFEHSNVFIQALSENQSKFESSIAEKPQSIVDSISKDIGKLTQTVYEKTMALAVALSESQQRLDTTLETHTNIVVEKISTTESKVNKNFGERINSICTAYADNHKTLETKLSSHAKLLENLITGGGGKLGSIIEVSSNIVKDLLDDSSSRMEKLLTGGVDDVNTVLLNAHQKFNETLGNRAETITAVLDEKCRYLDSNISEKASYIVSAVTESTSMMETSLKDRELSIRQTFNVSVDSFEKLSNNVERLSEKLNNVVNDVSQSAYNISSSLETSITDISTKIFETDIHFEKNISTFESRISGVVDEVSEIIDVAGQSINQKTETMSDVLRSEIDNVSNVLAKKAIQVTNDLSQVSEGFFETLEKGTLSLANRLEEHSNKIVSQVNDTHNFLTVEADNVVKSFEDAGISIATKVEAAKGIMSENIEYFSGKIDEASKILEVQGEKIHSDLITSSNSIIKTLEEADKVISSRSGTVCSTIEKQTHSINETLLNVDRTLETHNIAIQTNIEERTKEIESSILEVDKVLKERSSSINIAFNERTHALDSLLTSRSVELSQVIEEKTNRIMEQYSNIGDSISQRITATVLTGVKVFGEKNSLMLEAIDERVRNSANALSKVESILVRNVDKLISRIKESNADISSVINNATNDLSEIDNRLHKTTDNVAETANQVKGMLVASSKLFEGKVDELYKISGHTLSQINDIVNKFDEHARVLSQTRDLLLDAQSSTALTLDERAKALTALTDGLERKSTEIEESMTLLTKNIKEVFDQTEYQSEKIISGIQNNIETSFTEIGHALSNIEDRAEKSTNVINNNLIHFSSTFDSVEERAHSFSDLLLRDLASSFAKIEHIFSEIEQKSDQAVRLLLDTLQEAIVSSVSRFSEASEDIRRSASTISQELEITRSELRNGSMELSEEARESINFMRRAIGDQMKALQELAQVVNYQPNQLNISESEKDPSLPLPMAAGRNPTSMLSNPLKNLRSNRSDNYQDKFAKNDGWLSDLLHAASSNEEEELMEAPRSQDKRFEKPTAKSKKEINNSIDPVNSLASDIAKSVDHDAFINLWKRYTRGERNIFTRRLYTLKGQQLFDEIKQRYENDYDFRVAVDSYIADFEKILSDVTYSNSDPSITQSYIMSDSGKVYTMLAHASDHMI
ncbi:kinesin-like protein [Liberibacter crescens BT-1]|uniref:Kinesin-like protein n=1 Tax=Liberibacter crescens (strain BT-1) TaxID=1215343 RepID=L0EW88_LIBCB|nr:kinesin-like protein [Liberibacter crescens]AGA64636.1 kinesin-like protein [Liberibacter crescens BT-1]AMC12749.1 hypothetical protein RL73_03330 [Liberibacter crescens]